MARIKTTAGKLVLLTSVLAGVVTLFVYAAIQQALRQSANDPQIRMAEDGASALARGVSPHDISGNGQVNGASSLAPFVLILSPNGSVEAASGNFDGKIITPPAGSLAVARRQHETRFTWSPRSGVRQAAVVVWNGGAHPGFVVAARSLREVEVREGQVGRLAVLAVGVIIAVSAIFAVL